MNAKLDLKLLHAIFAKFTNGIIMKQTTRCQFNTDSRGILNSIANRWVGDFGFAFLQGGSKSYFQANLTVRKTHFWAGLLK